MKHLTFLLILSLVFCLFAGCAPQTMPADIAATTLPVYEFTTMLCAGTGLQVTQLVTESVSCLHDYALNVKQVKAVEAAQIVVINGAGLEDFMADLLTDKPTVDASAGIELLDTCHEHEHAHDHDHEADAAEVDAHIWLSPLHAATMAQNICAGLCQQYPQHAAVFQQNLVNLLAEIQALNDYGQAQLATLQQREVITFHDGFAYFAAWCDLEIVKAIEEESGAEASAAELIEIIQLARQHQIQAVFIEANGSSSAANIIAAEVGAKVFTLHMAMSGESWFDAMYHNIDTIKEALG